MVCSKFRLIAYFSIVVMVIMTVGSLLGAYTCLISKNANLIAFVLMMIIFAFFGFITSRIRVIEVNNYGINYKSAVLPFLKEEIAKDDIDYFITQTVYVRGGYYTNVRLVKDSKAVLSMSSRLYSNLQEMINALPWEYRGKYEPGFFDEFRLFTINEDKIMRY